MVSRGLRPLAMKRPVMRGSTDSMSWKGVLSAAAGCACCCRWRVQTLQVGWSMALTSISHLLYPASLQTQWWRPQKTLRERLAGEGKHSTPQSWLHNFKDMIVDLATALSA